MSGNSGMVAQNAMGTDPARRADISRVINTAKAVIQREGHLRPLYVLGCMMLPILWDGVPFAAVGLPRAGGYYLTTILMLCGVGLFFFRKMPVKKKSNVFVFSSSALVVLALAVSVISGKFFFYNPIGKWGPELVYYSPSFLIFLMIALDVRIGEMLLGVAIAAALSAVLVIADRIVPMTMMDQYSTVSGFGDQTRRIMLLKNDLGVAVALAFSGMVSARSFGVFAVSACIFLLVGFDLVAVTETRLVIGADLLAIAAFSLFSARVDRRLGIILLGFLAIIFLGPLIFARYIDRMESLRHLSDDGSVYWRFLTVDNYRKFFEQTHGIGIGLMSIKDGSQSVLAYLIFDAPVAYGIPRGQWGFFLADISLYAALFQFGYLGLALTVFMTVITALNLIRYGFNKSLPYREQVSITGFFVLFLLISPWPTNLFTISWSMMSGNMLFAAAARAWYIHRVHQNLDGSQPKR